VSNSYEGFVLSLFSLYKFLNDDDPRVTAILKFSASELFLINELLNIFCAYFFVLKFLCFFMIVVVATVALINFYLRKSSKASYIIASKPKFLNSKMFSTSVTILFFLLTTSIML
jgi:hypothetical protein